MLIRLISLLSKCSWSTLYKLSDIAAFVLFRILGYRKEVIDTNLKRSFPEKSAKELADIRKRFYTHFTDLIVETIKLSNCPREEIIERFRIDADLEQRLRKIDKGAVIVLGHRGNWEMANLFISAKNILEPIVVYKPLSDPQFEAWFKQIRTRFGSSMVPMKEVYAELEKERNYPYAVFLVNDQSPNPTRAYWTRFLNQDTGVYRGAEIIARKHGLKVIFADIRKVEGRRGYYEAVMTESTDEPEKYPQNALLEAQIRFLEKNIISQPYNWLWSHKRWKNLRPNVLQPEQTLGNPLEWNQTRQNS